MMSVGGDKIPERKFGLKKAIPLVIISLAIALGILAIFAGGDFSTLIHSLASIDFRLLLLAIGIYFIEVAVWTGRWRTALSASGYYPEFGSLYVISHGSKFLTNITPISKSGGEPFRAHFAKELHDIPYRVGFGTIFADAMFNIPAFATFLLAGLLFSSPLLQISSWALVITIICLAVLAVGSIPLIYYLLKRKTGSEKLSRLIGWIKKLFKRETSERKTSKEVEEFYASSKFAMEHRKAAVTMLALAFLLLSMTAVRFYVIFLALGYTGISWPVLFLGVSLPIILGLIPLLPGGLVIIEGSMAGVFIACGVPAPIAVSATLIERGISYLLSTLVGAGMASYLGAKIWKS